MTVQFISGLFFLKWALGPQLREAVPMFESPLLSQQQVGQAALIKGVGETLASRKAVFFFHSKARKGLEYHGLNFMKMKY